jgi:hypothetical protein
MTTTRISKIARLPANIREQLNLRLHNGDLGRAILPWVNSLPKTKKILAELFNGNAITHQNLSEWRATGYQDWLMQQERKHWFRNLNEQNTELDKHDQCSDTYEAMSRFFLYALGQSLEAAQKIKNPDARSARIETLTDKFSRLQNAYNWSRRVQLEFDKFNDTFEPGQPTDPETPADDNLTEAGGASVLASRAQLENHDVEIIEAEEMKTPTPVAQTFLSAGSRDFPVPCSDPADLGAPASRRPDTIAMPDAAQNQSPTATSVSFSSPKGGEGRDEEAVKVHGDNGEIESLDPKRQGAGALQDAPRTSKVENQNASPDITETLSDSNSSTPQLPNSQTPPPFHPIPTPPPTTQNPAIPNWKNHKVQSIPIRGRRFTCIEG